MFRNSSGEFLFLPFLLIFPITIFAQINCPPFTPSGEPGLHFPNGNPCVARDSVFSVIAQFENFGTFETSPPLPPATVTINYVIIDSITNLPCGLGWRTDKEQNIFRTSETGCIEIYGATHDTAGQYPLHIWITISILPVGTFQGEISELLHRLETATGTDLGYDFRTWIRVKEQNSFCPEADTSGSVDILSTGKSCFGVLTEPIRALNSFSVYPNPNTGSFKIDFHSRFPNDDYTLLIFDLTGRIIHHETYAGILSSVSVKLSGLFKGMYLLNLSSGQGSYNGRLVLY